MVLGEALISFCIPCMGRAHDLMRTLPLTIAAANKSPPVEVVVLDYNSQDGLFGYVDGERRSRRMAEGNRLTYAHYTRREHYHMAHAWNLAVNCSSGDYVVIAGADAVFAEGYVESLRGLIADECVWMRGRHYKGIVCVEREEFFAAGGYDERFEFYGGEDRDMEARLTRRGGKFGLVPDGMVRTLKTSNRAKVRNYASDLSKLDMILRNKAIRDENDAAGVLVANEGKPWGRMDGPWP